MAVNNKKKNIQPSSGYYDESSFVSLVSSLRDVSGDETPLNSEYVELNRNIYDMITPDIVSMNEGVVGIQYDTSKNALIINYSNGAKDAIVLTDNYLANAVYLEDEKKARFFIGGNNATIDMDLSSITNDYYTKKEVEDKIDMDLSSMTQNYYTKEEVENKIDADLSSITKDYYTKEEVKQMIDDNQGVSDSMEWGSF